MTPEYILKASLCREPFCGTYTPEARLSQIENMNYFAESVNGDTGEKGILVANWNYLSAVASTSLLERYSYELDWEEHSARRARMSAASTSTRSLGFYGETPYYWIDNDNGGMICAECTDPEEYLEYCEDSPTRAVNLRGVNPADHNYVEVERNFENGFHPGQNDDPQAIYKRLSEKFDHLLFVIDDVGQFDCHFSIWRKLHRVTCDQCQILGINGVACHETGCPNMGARWDEPTETWIKQRKCFDCGCTVNADDPCCSAEHRRRQHPR